MKNKNKNTIESATESSTVSQNDTSLVFASGSKEISMKAQQQSVIAKLTAGIEEDCNNAGEFILSSFSTLFRYVNAIHQFFSDALPQHFLKNRHKIARKVNRAAEEMLFPYRIISEKSKYLRHAIQDAKKEPNDSLRRKTIQELQKEYKKNTVRAYNRVAYFFAPLVGAAILAGVFGPYSQMKLAIKVEYNGETLGYIQNEQEFYDARNTMMERLINEEYIPPEDTIPVLTMAVVPESKLLSEEDLTNAILKTSGNELIDASGFYLDDTFIGAIEDDQEFLLYLDGILEEYRTDAENETVQFTKRVTLKKGVYPVSSVLSIASLQNYMRSNNRLERTYIAYEGDTVTAIAKRYGISTSQLLKLNNDLEDHLIYLQNQKIADQYGWETDEQGNLLIKGKIVDAEQLAKDQEEEHEAIRAAEEEAAALKAYLASLTPEELQDYEANIAEETEKTDKASKQNKGAKTEEEKVSPLSYPDITWVPIEDFPLDGEEEILVSSVNVGSLGIQVTRRETYIGKVAYGTTYIDDNTRPTDMTTLYKSGVYGTEEITADITYINGKKVSESVITRTRLTDPVNQIVKRGTLSLSEYLGNTGGGFIWPADSGYFNGSLNSYRGHTGMDIACPIGTQVRAAKAGTVITAASSGWNYGYGRTIVINHGNGQVTRYAHLSAVSVRVGQYVQQGQVIGKSGNSGNSSGPHLHFEVRIDGIIKDPVQFIGKSYSQTRR